MLDVTNIDLDRCTLLPKAFSWATAALDAIEVVASYGNTYAKGILPVRAFVEQGTRDDYRAKVASMPREAAETLSEWTRRIFGRGDVCLVMNGLDAWSDAISDIVRRSFSDRWVRTQGGPIGGIDVYAFMGSYPQTPFGVHKDLEHTFLFHLGPNVKLAFVWEMIPPSQVKERGGFVDSEAFKAASFFELHAGDLLFIPAGMYHVLANPEFSVTLGVAPYDRPISSLVGDVVRDYVQSCAISQVALKTIVDPRTSQLVGPEGQQVDLEPLIREMSARLNEEVALELRRLASRGYAKYGPPEREISVAPDSEFSSGHHMLDVFKLGNAIHLLARGYEYSVPLEAESDVTSFATLMNRSGDWTLRKLADVGDFIRIDLIDTLVGQLCSIGALRLKESRHVPR